MIYRDHPAWPLVGGKGTPPVAVARRRQTHENSEGEGGLREARFRLLALRSALNSLRAGEHAASRHIQCQRWCEIGQGLTSFTTYCEEQSLKSQLDCFQKPISTYPYSFNYALHHTWT